MGVYTAKDFPELSRLQADRTAKQLNSMNPAVAQRTFNTIAEYNQHPQNVSAKRVASITEGYRSLERSDKLAADPTVYAASGGNSWHNYGAAADIIIIEDGNVDEYNRTGNYTGLLREVANNNGMNNPFGSNDSGHFQAAELSNGVPSSVKDGSTSINNLIGEPNEVVEGDVDLGNNATANTGNWSPTQETIPYQDLSSQDDITKNATLASQGSQLARDELVLGYKTSLQEHVKNNPHLTVKDLDISDYANRSFELTKSADPVEQAKGFAMEEALNIVSADLATAQGTENINLRDEQDPMVVTDGNTPEITSFPQSNVQAFEALRPDPNWYTSVDLATYKFTLYLVSPAVFNDPETYLENDSAAINTDKAQIISQTGTETYYNLDNLLFQSKLFGDDTKGSVQTTTFQFEIKEPIGFTLLEKILTKAQSYTFNTMKDAKYVLKLELQGRDQATGVPVKFHGAHYYPLVAIGITSETGPEGTAYIFTCGSVPATGAQESVVKAGQVTVNNVTTLKSFLQNLSQTLNKSEIDAISPTTTGSLDAAESADTNRLEARKTWDIYVDDTETLGNGKYVSDFNLESMIVSASNSAGQAADMEDKDTKQILVSNETNIVSYLKDFITKQPDFNEYYKTVTEEKGIAPIVDVTATPVYEERIHEQSKQQFVTIKIAVGITMREIPLSAGLNESEKFTVSYQNTRFNDLPIAKKYEYVYTGQNTEVLNMSRQFNLLFAQATDPRLGANTANSTTESPGTNLPTSRAFLSDNAANSVPDDILTQLPRDTQVSSQHRQLQIEQANNTQELLASYALQYDARKGDMNIVELDIIGDPYWLGIPGSYVNDKISSSLAKLNKGGQAFVALKNYFPDADTFSKGKLDLYSTGIYEVREVEHRFQQGQYVSKLTMYRDINSNTFILQNRIKDI